MRIYASYAQGWRSGGFSTRANNPTQLTYEPENVDSYEVGFKSDLMDGKVRLNLTAFYTDVQDAQFSVVLQDPNQAPGTNTVINNHGGDLKVKGIEVDLIAQLHDNFMIVMSFGSQDGKTSSYTEDSARLPVGPNGTGGTAGIPTLVPGVDIARTPEVNWSLTGIFDRQFGSMRATASLSARGSSEYAIITDALTQQDISTDPGTRVDARVSLEWNIGDGDIITLSVIGKNLTEEEYLDFVLPLGDVGGFQGWGAPRTIAAEIKWLH